MPDDLNLSTPALALIEILARCSVAPEEHFPGTRRGRLRAFVWRPVDAPPPLTHAELAAALRDRARVIEHLAAAIERDAAGDWDPVDAFNIPPLA